MTNTLMDVYAGRTHAAPLGALDSRRRLPVSGTVGRPRAGWFVRVSGCWCPFVVRTHSTVHSEGDKPMPHTIRKNAREWQRLWRGGDIITEADGDDPGMPRRGRRKRMARVTSLGIRGRVSTARNVARR